MGRLSFCNIALDRREILCIIALMSGAILSPQELLDLAKTNGWTLSALCEKANTAPSTVTRWRRGAHNLNTVTYQRLLNAASIRAPKPLAATEAS